MASRRLAVESLERRLLLAGDVSATVKGGWLVVTGDDLGNQVKVEIADIGEAGVSYRVQGNDGTAINGVVDGVYDSPVVTKGIKVDLKKDDDRLEIVGDTDLDPVFQLNGDLSIKMGDGDDYVELANAEIGGKTTIDLGKGEGGASIDLVTFGKDVAVKAGDAPGGEDPHVEIGIARADVTGNLTVTTGKTNDYIWLEGVTVTKNVTIKTGDGEDYAGVEGWEEEPVGDDIAPAEAPVVDEVTPSLIEGKLSIDIGKGGGWMWLGDTTVKKDVSFKAGDAPVFEDELSQGVDVFAATIQGKLTIKLGKGDAAVWLNQVTVDKDVSINTGDGDDWIAFEPASVDSEEDLELFANGANSVLGGKVTLNSGRGDDLVAITSADVTGALSINTGDGYDTLGLWQVAVTSAKSNVSINTGNQSDRIAIVELQAAGNVTLDSGNAVADEEPGDQVLVTNSDIEKNLTVKTGKGHDQVGIGTGDFIDAALEELLLEFEWDGYGIVADLVNVGGKLTVSTGNGWDGLSISWCDIVGSASVDMGGGTDECEILDTTVGAGASVKMGAGDEDYLAVGDTDVTGKVTLDGGSGIDDWLDNLGGNTYTQEPTIKGFEN
ncbi:MAG: LEPR-XLL domain-containing protein [Pirellulaceae bacterium]|nr:LEPR-XLL domain-containing protein [Pirellulaceae bacterium]